MTTKPKHVRMSDATMKALANEAVAGNQAAALAIAAEAHARFGDRYDHLNTPQGTAGLRQWQADREQREAQAAAASILAAAKPKGGVN